MSTWIWVLTFTVLGSTAEHGHLAKFETRADCEQHLQVLKQEAQRNKKHLAGHCHLVLKTR